MGITAGESPPVCIGLALARLFFDVITNVRNIAVSTSLTKNPSTETLRFHKGKFVGRRQAAANYERHNYPLRRM